MAVRFRSAELGARLSIPLIALAVVLVAALQYGWFSRSAEVEIDGAERSLRATVYQVLAREFQRYAPIVGDVRELLARGRAESADLEAFLERELMLYGPEGTSPGLIGSAAIFVGAGGAADLFLDEESGSWTKGVGSLPPQVQKRLSEDDGSGAIFLDFATRLPDDDRPIEESGGFLYASRGGPVPLTIAIGIDAEGFFQSYLRPAVAAVLPDAEIAWASGRDAEEYSRARDAGRYSSFNPLLALLGVGSERTRTFAVSVPTGFASFFRAEPDRGPGGGTMITQRVAAPDAPSARGVPGTRVAIVTLGKSSAIGTMERRLALNWLFGTGLLIGLGTALVMSIIQRRRLALARQREREFVASVTHELRTPVTAIRSAADNIRRGLVSGERLASYGEMIHGEALRLGDMVEEVIISSRVEARSPGPPALAEVDAGKFLEGLRPPLEEIAEAGGVRLIWDFGALPRAFMCDAESLRLIIANLATNAIYHAYSGAEKGDVRILGRSSLPSSLRFVVEDDGRGIAKAEAQLVFEAFYRDETSRARAEKGTGLGLFIARRKARELGGDLALESPYRRVDGSRKSGCRFVLELPLREPGDAR
jgi:signal transduction histidine kinase